MESRLHAGDKAYIVDNRIFLREVTINRVTKDFCIIVYKDTGACIRVRKSRLFSCKDEAIKTMPASARPKRTSHWDYYLTHM